MTDKQTENKPNNCLCGEQSSLKSDGPRYQVRCEFCGRRSSIAEIAQEAITDWNRQTAAPDLLDACKMAYRASIRDEKLTEKQDAQLEAAITKAEKT